MTSEDQSSNIKDRIESALEEYSLAWFSGNPPDLDVFYRRFPDCEEALRKEIDEFLYVAGNLDQAVKTGGTSLGEETTADVDADVSGEVLGDFRLIREIGRGGMGVVYEAEQVSLHRKVALKVLFPHLSLSRESVQKFQREAEAGGRQRHPGIVAVYAVGEHEGSHYLAQELVEEGSTLADRLDALREKGSLPQDHFLESARLLIEVTDALHDAHETGVIHRDIKPSNILLTRSGRSKVTDFGLAKLEDALALSRTGDFAGTPYYMSPEQVSSETREIDRRTDIYSLGVTLYEMLTLNKPFEGKTSHDVLKKIPLTDPMDPEKVNPRIPRDLSVICLKAMEKSPEKRYGTMKEFGDDLSRFLTGEVILAKPAGSMTRVMKRIKRNPVLTGAIGVAALAVLALMIWGVVYFIQMKNRYEEISRHSDLNLVYRLRVEADKLWPAYPQKIQDLRRWLDEARGLLTRQEQYRSRFERLQSAGPITAEDADLKDFLEKLTGEIDFLGHEETGLILDVAKRLYFAETVRKISFDTHKAAWNEAITSIANEQECPQYKGGKMEPLLGFVPLDRDPDSGLWEFAHLQTGDIPVRDEEKRLILTEETGLVFVLIPGGTFRMGAVKPDGVEHIEGDPNVDPEARSFEGPIHDVTIQKPFLLSKYEMTQGQWLRITGGNPSIYGPGSNIEGTVVNLMHPVESVNWADCIKVLSRLNLRLPTEAEWEYAARAGTDPAYWTGNDWVTLEGAANLLDRSSYEARASLGMNLRDPKDFETRLDDGYPVHAPVGSYSPNPFGLHDVCGNVFEWCQDSWSESYERTPTDGSALELSNSVGRVYRGGGWDSPPRGCRSAFRYWFDQRNLYYDQGLRPAFSLP